ncbi:MAG: hypothetical protein J6Y44_01040, partial [Clostridia bacterium]|nr:hypothetical protein [Clostridia bacterium]
MIKRVFTILIAALILACGVITFSACTSTAKGQEDHMFYSLKKAYDDGLLTQEDIMCVSYYLYGEVILATENINGNIMYYDYSPYDFTPRVQIDELKDEEIQLIKEYFASYVGYPKYLSSLVN